MRSILLRISGGGQILINVDQIVAVGVYQCWPDRTWISMTNGADYSIDSPFEEVITLLEESG